MERRLIIGTAGHIDHGKTALVKALTGVDTDRLPEEKKRGITIDLGFAPLHLEGVGVVGIVDVPGHEDFVRSMLVGASGIHLALLIVAADEGVMPQTREHLRILELLRIPRVVVALTKTDLVDEEWASLVCAEVRELFASARIWDPPIIQCSSKTGAGIAELRTILRDALSDATVPRANDVFRLPVDRAFSVKGTGTVVTGTVWSGELAVDANVRVLPANTHARARRIEQHGKPAMKAVPGSRAAIALSGLDLTDVQRGAVVVTDAGWRATSMVEALVQLDENARARLSNRSEIRLHVASAETAAHLSIPRRARTADGAFLARIELDPPIAVRGGDRFVLRLPAPLRTIGGGVVVDPFAQRRPLDKLAALDISFLVSDARARLGFVLDSAGASGVGAAELPIRIGCTPDEALSYRELPEVIAGPHNLFSRKTVEEVMAAVQRIVAEYEIHSPLSIGVPARTLREQLRVAEELADIAIAELEKRADIESAGPVVKRKGWKPTPTATDVEATNLLAHDICAATREPPSVNELVSRYGSSVPVLLRYLERQGRIVQVEADRYYDRNTLDAMIAKLKGSLVPGMIYAPAQLRDVLGSSRKYLIPFLEFCDRSGVTERRGDGRILRQTSGAQLDTSRTES